MRWPSTRGPLALRAELRSLDALHLASALLLGSGDLALASWDVRLHSGAVAEGLRAIPERID